MYTVEVTAAMAVDRQFVNIVLVRRPSNGDPKLPRSMRLSPKPLKSMPRDHPEGSQSQPRRASDQRCSHSGLKTVKQLFRGTPLCAKSSKVLRLPTKSSLAELAGHSYVYLRLLRLSTFATFPTHQVLLRAPFLHAPGARMTVVELKLQRLTTVRD